MPAAAPAPSIGPPGTPAAEAAILRLEDIHLAFGGVKALQGVGFDVKRGSILSIIGPNGAGKTSLLNVISGVYAPSAGRIALDGVARRMTPGAVAWLGIARTFQNVALFRGMSVRDNILIGRHARMRAGVLACGLWLGPGQREEREHRRAIEDTIAFLELGHVADLGVETLAYGLQKRVELARALALEPRLLLLDEPMAGMNAGEKRDMVRFILRTAEAHGTTVIFIEHDMGVVMEISHRVVVLDYGRKIAEGTPAEVRADPAVLRAYLGTEE